MFNVYHLVQSNVSDVKKIRQKNDICLEEYFLSLWDPLFPVWGMHPGFMSEKNSNRGKSIPRIFSEQGAAENASMLVFLPHRCFRVIGFVSTLKRCSLVD